MAGTKEGGIKAAATNKKRYGKGWYAQIGRIGGHCGHTGGFAANPKLASIAGRKGGLMGSRAGIKNGEGKSPKGMSLEEIESIPRRFKIYVHHKRSKREVVEVRHG